MLPAGVLPVLAVAKPPAGELSVAMHPNCPDVETAASAVSMAWAACYKDTAPFDEHPTFRY